MKSLLEKKISRRVRMEIELHPVFIFGVLTSSSNSYKEIGIALGPIVIGFEVRRKTCKSDKSVKL